MWHHRPLPPAVGSDGIREFAQRFADVRGPYEILLQVADGRIKAWRDYFDTGSLTRDDPPA